MKKGSVLVTGAYGFIGRNAARFLAQEGRQVIGMGHGGWTREEWREWGIAEWHSCDITIDSLLTYAGEPEVIMHCAGSGSVGFSVSHPFQDYQRTVDSTCQVLEFMRLHAPAAKMVYPSSAAVYGVAPKAQISEESPLRPVSPYGMHKLMAEELCRSYGRHFGIASSIVRFFSVYGVGLRKQLLWDCCSKAQAGERSFFGTGRETRDFLHVQDAVALLAAAAEHADGEPPIVNGGSGGGMTVGDIVRDVFAAFSRPEAPVFTGNARPGDPEHYAADISKARSWGWRPNRDWTTGVREYVTWFSQGAV